LGNFHDTGLGTANLRKSLSNSLNFCENKFQTRMVSGAIAFMLPKKFLSTISLAVLISSITAAKSVGTRFADPALAQSPAPTTFPLPSSVPQGTSIRIDGSSSMATLNETLRQRFEKQFPGTNVSVNYSGTDAALKALAQGTIDLAAIGRPLTAAEKAQGLVAVPLNRGKIAIIVGSENPLKSSITVPQFIQTVRGEITNWSQLGGQPGPIRFVDRPDLSDTRAAFSTYDIFQNTPYQPGSTTTRLGEDSTRSVIQTLGKDGISFAPANQINNQPNVRALPLYNTLPSDPRYPFSQPYFYVYNKTPSPAVSTFLGFATAPNQILSTFQPTETAIDAGRTPSPAIATNATTSPNAVSSPVASPNAAAPSPGSPASPNATAPNTQSPVGGVPGNSMASRPPTEMDAGLPAWLWWLLPLGLGALLLGLLARGRRSRRGPISESVPPESIASPDAPPPPPPIGPSAYAPVEPEPDLVTRMGNIISSDRAAVRQTQDESANATFGSGDVAQASDLNPGAAMLGGAALADGTAAFGSPFQPGEVSVSETADEPLATFDLIEDFDVLETQLSDANAVELDLDDAPNTDAPDTLELSGSNGPVDVTEPTPAFSDVTNEVADQPVIEDDVDSVGGESSTELDFDTALSDVDEANQDSIAAITALGGAGLAATGFAAMSPSPESLPVEGAPFSPPESNAEVDLEASSIPSDSIDAIEAPLEDASPESDIISEPSIENAPPGESGSIPGSAVAVGLGGAAIAAGFAGMTAFTNDEAQTDVEAAKFDVGQTDLSSEELASVDEGLPNLPDGYGESRIVLLPRDPQWAYAYWDIPNEHKEAVRRQGGQTLVLRLADVTDLGSNAHNPHSLQQYDCDELARDWYLPIPVSDRDYLVEIGYLTADGHWLMVARSQAVRIPPVYPSDWFDEQFVSIDWEEDLRGKTFGNLVAPDQQGIGTRDIYDQTAALSLGAEAQRVSGSLFGSMQHLPDSAVSSFVFPSGMGMWALPIPSGMGMSGVNMSGVGFSASAVPIRPRKFWMVADAELIVYGATEPDALVTIAGQPIPLNADGTFRFQLSFQDGLLDYPIMAIAADGEQTRLIHLKFTRETPKRNTNTKEDAVDEWPS
jgi:ABC-type phosphate transport system substrate-binding protein